MPRDGQPSDHVPISADLAFRHDEGAAAPAVAAGGAAAAAPARRGAPKRARAGEAASCTEPPAAAVEEKGRAEAEAEAAAAAEQEQELAALGVAALKRLVAAAGLSSEGCLERSELRARAREAQALLAARSRGAGGPTSRAEGAVGSARVEAARAVRRRHQ